MSDRTTMDRARSYVPYGKPFPIASLLWPLALLGLVLWVATFSQSTSSPLMAPPNHDPECQDCSACHGPPLDANENLAPQAAVGTGQVYGYASASSVAQGGKIDFHVSTDASVASYDIQIFRAGTDNPVPIMTIANLPGGSYPCGPVGVQAGQEDVDLGCDWPVAYTLDVPTDWPSGYYMAALLDEEDQLYWNYGGYYIHFIVREDQPGSTADILFQASTNTWQAYNEWGGWSLYTEPPARRITFDRPYQRCTIGRRSWSTCGIKWEISLASWLESEGYGVEYVANEDVHADPTLLLNYSLFVSVGHDEYWSKEMRDHIEAFIDAGGNVAIFSGNTSFRQVRYQDAGRTLVCYKFEDRTRDPLYGVDNIRVASTFAADPVFWPENLTTGVGFRNGGWVNVPNSGTVGRYTVYHSDHWVYEGTGLQDNDEFWYEPSRQVEVDGALFTWEDGRPVVTGADDTPADFIILSVQPSTDGHATMGIYRREGGGTVFNAATMGWGHGLWPANNPQDYPIVRQITRNIVETLTRQDLPIGELVLVNDSPTPLGLETALTATISMGSNVSYVWDFGDGSPVYTTYQATVAHTYLDVGDYTAVVTASNGAGALSATTTVDVVYTPELAVSVVAEPGSVTAGAPLTYTIYVTNTGNVDLHATVIDILPAQLTADTTVTWTPTITTTGGVWTQVVVVTPTAECVGLLTNVVQVTTEEGATGASTSTVTVTDVPMAGLAATDDGPTPLASATALTATVSTGSNVVYTWTFGDGGTGSGDSVTHVYPAAGVYTAVVTASNSANFLTTTTKIAVDEMIVGLTLTSDSPTSLGRATVFTAAIGMGSNVSYTWDFGDGSPSLTTSWTTVEHTYPAVGVYTAVVRADNAVSTLTAMTSVMIPNTAPTLAALPDQVFDREGLLPGMIDLWAYAWDAESLAGELTYALEGTLPVYAGVMLADGRYVHVEPGADWCGWTNVVVRVTDPGGLWAIGTFRIVSSVACEGPLPLPDQRAPRDHPITVDLKDYEPQLVQDTTALVWYVTGTDHCTVSGEYNADHVLTFTPQKGFVGSDTVTLHMVYPWGTEATGDVVLRWESRLYIPIGMGSYSAAR